MFETGIRQMRMAMAMVWGKPINPRNIERLIRDALKTLDEFGAPGDDFQQLLEGPFTDPAARKEFQQRALQLTARRLDRVSAFYHQRFSAAGIALDDLTIEAISAIPLTQKRDLLTQQQAFIAADARPYLTTRTTGTTGAPAEIWLSEYEISLWPAMAALSGVLRNELRPDDCLQINISSRATAATQQNMTICRLADARTRMLGVIPPEESLDSLLDGDEAAPTLLATYPSYLALLTNAARARHLHPSDFHLRRIDCGGEILSSALAQAAHETFGAVINDTFGMTEVLPVSGRICSLGHLHYDLNMGYIEVLDLVTGKPAAPDTLGTVVITPYYPYRECMPVFRYNTRDIVQMPPDGPLGCELAAIPGVSKIVGKEDHLLRLGERVITLRALIEIYEALPSRPWPARFSTHVVDDVIELTAPASALQDVTTAEVERRFQEHDIPVRLQRIDCGPLEAMQLRSVRADLLETTFVGRR